MLLELAKEIRVYGKNRGEIELTFRGEYAIEYLEINQEVIESTQLLGISYTN